MQEAITPETKVEEVLKRWPQVIPVFTRHRMGCVGCTMAPFETLGGAAGIYHLSLENFLNEIQKTIREHDSGL
jgi:hybrid cluster-associated redox disulfide protein